MIFYSIPFQLQFFESLPKLDAQYGSFLNKLWDNDITVTYWMSKIYKNDFKVYKPKEKVNYL